MSPPSLPALDLTKVISLSDFAMHSGRTSNSTASFDSVDVEGLPTLRQSYRTPRPSRCDDAAAEASHPTKAQRRGPFIFVSSIVSPRYNHNPIIFDGLELGSSDIFLRRLEEAEGRDARRIAGQRSASRCLAATARFGSFSDSDSDAE
jgi:hypothetical protein